MPRILKNGWEVEDVNGVDWEYFHMDRSIQASKERTRQSYQASHPGEVILDHFGSYAFDIPINELETMDNLVCFQNDTGFWVRWDGVEYGPFDTLGAPHAVRIDGVIVIYGSREEMVDDKKKRAFYIIAQGKMRGPFRSAFTPRFERGYFADEPRFDGDYVVWGEVVLGPYKMVCNARLTRTNIRVFTVYNRLPYKTGDRTPKILDASARTQFTT